MCVRVTSDHNIVSFSGAIHDSTTIDVDRSVGCFSIHGLEGSCEQDWSHTRVSDKTDEGSGKYTITDFEHLSAGVDQPGS